MDEQFEIRWPFKWEFVIKRDKADLPWNTDGFCKAAVLESVDDILVEQDLNVMINVVYGGAASDPQGVSVHW